MLQVRHRTLAHEELEGARGEVRRGEGKRCTRKDPRVLICLPIASAYGT